MITSPRFLTALTLTVVLQSAQVHADPIPDTTLWYYVPQAGTVAAPVEGTSATQYFRACPNNDGGASLPNNARIKVVIRDVNGNGIQGIAANDICILFNGGTPQQGYSGVGADSVVANSQYTFGLCPDLRCISADAPTDQFGATYITFAGSTPGSPGVATRDFTRKWGHYDTELPVYCLGFKFSGRLTSTSANGTYTLRIKSFDFIGGLGTVQGTQERVSIDDLNSVSNNLGVSDALSYWRDFNSDGSVTTTDLNMIQAHINHNCTTPNSP